MVDYNDSRNEQGHGSDGDVDVGQGHRDLMTQNFVLHHKASTRSITDQQACTHAIRELPRWQQMTSMLACQRCNDVEEGLQMGAQNNASRCAASLGSPQEYMIEVLPGGMIEIISIQRFDDSELVPIHRGN